MTHILVKWPKEKAWDVYPVRALVDASVGLQLLSDNTAIKTWRGRKVMVIWKEGEPAAEAQLLGFGFGTCQGRARLWSGMGGTCFIKIPSTCSVADEHSPECPSVPAARIAGADVQATRQNFDTSDTETCSDQLVTYDSDTEVYYSCKSCTYTKAEKEKEKQNNQNLSNARFLKIPKVRVHECGKLKQLSERRQREWIARLSRKGVSENPDKYKVIRQAYLTTAIWTEPTKAFRLRYQEHKRRALQLRNVRFSLLVRAKPLNHPLFICIVLSRLKMPTLCHVSLEQRLTAPPVAATNAALAAATSAAPSVAASPRPAAASPAPSTPEKELKANVDAVCQMDMSKEDINELEETIAQLRLQLSA
ncbi:hypothetical protein HPB48_026215 [Haemaphysalis longicornis]|uniref:Uncharacterized protein n=1 Tax=Haemaphysalis longicornis TaxID=44386 RepID=A0A9J6H8Z4_HAELO|nr:hypothetical protein HPB48_026215 [Haemaphysalis longicornis]